MPHLRLCRLPPQYYERALELSERNSGEMFACPSGSLTDDPVTIKMAKKLARALAAQGTVETLTKAYNYYDIALRSERASAFCRQEGLSDETRQSLMAAREQLRALQHGRQQMPDEIVSGGKADRVCAQCSTSGASLLKCAFCKAVYYCSQQCQRTHWQASHKQACSRKFEPAKK
jgi:hypothetical protein